MNERMDEWFRIFYRQRVAHVRDVHLPYLSVEYGPCFRSGMQSRDYFTHRILWLQSIQLMKKGKGEGGAMAR